MKRWLTWIFRKKESTADILERLNKKIEEKQRLKYRNQQRLKQWLTAATIYVVFLYVVLTLGLLIYYRPRDWLSRCLYTLPVLSAPFLIYGLRRFLHWFFLNRLSHYDDELRALREEKKDILNTVQETETYKKAKEILERFDPDSIRQQSIADELRRMRSTSSDIVDDAKESDDHSENGYVVRRRVTDPNSPRLSRTPQRLQQSDQRSESLPKRVLPRPLMPQQRGSIDRLLDFVVGDGPSARYALICSHCRSHNGMALSEEFPFCAYRCAYCNFYNAARKQKPSAPDLEQTQSTNVSQPCEKPVTNDSIEEEQPESPENMPESDQTLAQQKLSDELETKSVSSNVEESSESSAITN